MAVRAGADEGDLESHGNRPNGSDEIRVPHDSPGQNLPVRRMGGTAPARSGEKGDHR